MGVSPSNPSPPSNEGLGGGGDAYGTRIEGLNRKTQDWQKIDKSAVHYRQAMSGERCGTCQHGMFPPQSPEGSCMVVQGIVNRDFVCDQYEPMLFVQASQEPPVDFETVKAIVASLSLDSLSMISYARKFSTDQRKQLAKQGKALPDGSYPIENTGDLKNAVRLARSGHGNVPAAKRHIKKMAKQLGAETLLPEDWGQDGGDN